MSFSPTKLIFPLRRTRLREETERKLRDPFGIDFGETFYPVVKARFKRADGAWGEKLFTLIFDTGASMTLLPTEMTEYLGEDTTVEHEVSGVVPKPECKLPVKIRRISARLEDGEGHVSPELKIWASISEIVGAPFLLGMKDILDRMEVTLSPVKKELLLAI